jgi:hypothetical protein
MTRKQTPRGTSPVRISLSRAGTLTIKAQSLGSGALARTAGQIENKGKPDDRKVGAMHPACSKRCLCYVRTSGNGKPAIAFVLARR